MVDVSIQPVSPTSARPTTSVQDVKVPTSSVPQGSQGAVAAADAQSVANAKAAADGALRQTDEKTAEKAASKAKEAAGRPQLRLSIAFNEEAQRFVYKGIDAKGKTVSQYPTEDALQRIAVLRQAFSDTLTGVSSRGSFVNTTL